MLVITVVVVRGMLVVTLRTDRLWYMMIKGRMCSSVVVYFVITGNTCNRHLIIDISSKCSANNW